MPVGGMIAGAIAEFAGAPVAVGFGGFMVAGMASDRRDLLSAHSPLGTVAEHVLKQSGWRKKKPRKSPAVPRKRRKLAGNSTGLSATEFLNGAPPKRPSTSCKHAIDKDGGKVLATYREPFGGHWLVLAALPIDQVEPTPYQRNLSDTHARKLEGVIAKLGRFLDPIIVVRKESKGQRHALLDAQRQSSLVGDENAGRQMHRRLVVPETPPAYQILALNTEKAHNLRERALEVIKMYQELATLDDATEESYALEFEEAALITLGLCYLENGRFSGGAYHPILRRSDQFIKKPLKSRARRFGASAPKR